MSQSLVDREAKRVFDLDPDALRCPVAVFRRMAELEPVHFVPELDLYFVTTYDLIVEAVRRTGDFSNERAAFTENHLVDDASMAIARDAGDADLVQLYENLHPFVLVRSDPPRHSRQRALVNRAFTPARVKRLEPMVTEIVDELLDPLLDLGELDFCDDFASPLTVRVICRSLRCSDADAPRLKRWADDLIVAHTGTHLTADTVERLARSRIAFDRFFLEKMDEARDNPGDDMIGAVVHATPDDGEEPLTDNEMLYMFQQFLAAGTETTATTLGNAVVLLATRPDLAAGLRGGPDGVSAFVEEVLRWDPPTLHIYRTASRDTELGGVRIPEGARVVLYWASGSRDPGMFDDPDTFRADRERNAHLAFGHGPHYCVGAPLARLELRVAIDRFLQRTGSFRLAVDESELARVQNSLLHAYGRIPLVVQPRQ